VQLFEILTKGLEMKKECLINWSGLL